MSIGPVELLVVKFPGNQFTGEVGPALKELVDSGTIRVIDLLFATDQTDLLTHDDARTLAARLGPDSSGAILLFENTWATKFRDALLGAGGELVLSERIPKAAVDAMVESAA
jgi:hypothetical protein